jgi:uncharacterized membrane protein YcaP (DUF421 family)
MTVQRRSRRGVCQAMETLRTLIGPDNGDASAGQLCARAVILFAIGIIYIRIAGRRTFSQATPVDIIVAIIVGSNLSRAMTGKAPFLPALAATLLLVVLHRLTVMAAIRWDWLARLVKGSPVVLVREGVEDRKAMLRHGIAARDLQEALRLEKVEEVGKAKLATLENSGRISVVPSDKAAG